MLNVILLTLAMFFPSLLALFTMHRIAKSIKKYQLHPKKLKPLPMGEVPSVSICIPARNEAGSMTACLENAIKSNYPKLEILVLDDNSVDNTSVLIKSFANAGVRFISGGTLPEGWLGRNYAYQRLLKEASGEYILFMSVDNNLMPDTISQLISYMASKKIDMLSLLPIRADNYRASILFAPLRFFMSILFNNHKSPSTYSGAWLIKRDALKMYQSDFSDHKADILVETAIASHFYKTKKYHFIISPVKDSSLNYEKKWRSQVETSTRLYALGLRGHPLKWLLNFIAIILAVTPYVAFTALAILGIWNFYTIVFMLTGLLLMASYALYAKHVWSRGFMLAFILFPVVITQELFIFISAPIKRFQGALSWKGRNLNI